MSHYRRRAETDRKRSGDLSWLVTPAFGKILGSFPDAFRISSAGLPKLSTFGRTTALRIEHWSRSNGNVETLLNHHSVSKHRISAHSGLCRVVDGRSGVFRRSICKPRKGNL